MNTADLIWLNGEFVAWEDAKVHVLTHALHYGTGVFEGIRAYETSQGPAIFRQTRVREGGSTGAALHRSSVRARWRHHPRGCLRPGGHDGCVMRVATSKIPRPSRKSMATRAGC